jgi:hypothetical protein
MIEAVLTGVGDRRGAVLPGSLRKSGNATEACVRRG